MLLIKRSSLILASILLGCSAGIPILKCLPASADDAGAFSAMSLDPCGAVEKLVREYYPKAVITKNRGEITFEYKVHKKNGFYADKAAMVPADGGIEGTVTLTPGEYAGADKNEIPAEKPNGFYMVLTMAPYSKRQNSHLLAKVIFPQDVPANFKDKFRALIKSFNEPEITPVAAQPNQQEEKKPETTPEAAETPTKHVSDSWPAVARPDYRLTFKAPAGVKAKDNADKSGTTWKVVADGVEYTVAVSKPKAALITDAQRIQAMNAMVSSMNAGKKSKMEKAFNFQGLTAQEYALTDTAGAASKAIVCVSAGMQYLFMAGGANYKNSKVAPEFFDAIKIGNIK